MAADWMRKMREAFAQRQEAEAAETTPAGADPYLDALTNAQFERRRALMRGDDDGYAHWAMEVSVLIAMGRDGFATLRGGDQASEFMAEATEEAEADAEADSVLTIEFDEDGTPWCWAPDGWSDEQILDVLRHCVRNYEDTSEDHL